MNVHERSNLNFVTSVAERTQEVAKYERVSALAELELEVGRAG
jgi:hypothetical protein